MKSLARVLWIVPARCGLWPRRIVLDGAEAYRLRRKEHCFEVTADIERTRRSVAAAQRFRAHETANGKRWSMRERGDAPIRR
jgi:hypothetical protein